MTAHSFHDFLSPPRTHAGGSPEGAYTAGGGGLAAVPEE